MQAGAALRIIGQPSCNRCFVRYVQPMSKENPQAHHPLTRGAIDYIAHDPVGNTVVHVEFAGQFEGRTVIWQATIIAMDRADAQQYIEVRMPPDGSPIVEIGLPLSAINEPDILKTILMVRHYKNLRRGRHSFAGIAK